MARETWLQTVARRAILPVAVVERAFAAAVEVGPDPDLAPGTAVDPALRQALAAERERRQAEAFAALRRERALGRPGCAAPGALASKLAGALRRVGA